MVEPWFSDFFQEIQVRLLSVVLIFIDMNKIPNKYSLNRLFKVTYLDGRVEMISARGILNFVTNDSQDYIQSIEIIAISSFIKSVNKEYERDPEFDDYPSFIEYNIKSD